MLVAIGKINEVFDFTVVKSFNFDACLAAVGEMLLQNWGIQLSQEEIAKKIGIFQI